MIKIKTVTTITDEANPSQDIIILAELFTEDPEQREIKTFACLKQTVDHIIKFKVFEKPDPNKQEIDWQAFADYMYDFNNRWAARKYQEAGINVPPSAVE